MQKLSHNPYINSLFAEAYIITVATVIHTIGKQNTRDTFLDSIAALSLVTLSAAVMGYLFFGKPIMLYLDGEKQSAFTFLGKTIFGFAIITTTLIVLIKIF